MKLLLFTLSMLIVGIVYCQEEKSKADQLREYNSLLKEGLIDSTEYQKLKEQLLFGGDDQDKKSDLKQALQDTLKKESLQAKAKSQLIGGAVIMTLGMTGIIGGIIYKNRKPIRSSSETYEEYQNRLDKKRKGGIGLITFGAVIGLAGMAIVIKGTINKSKSLNENVSLNYGILDNGNFGLAFNFKQLGASKKLTISNPPLSY